MKALSLPLSITLALLALSCASDTTRPVDEHSLVLAYGVQSGLNCGVVLASLSGESRQIEHSCGYAPAWSPDGAHLAFNIAGGEAAPPALWTINADGSDESEVTGGRGLVGADWSPDGSRLAAISLGAGTIVIMHPDGTARSELAAAGFLSYDRVSWSPDGTEILFARLDTVWAVNANTGATRVVAVPALEHMYGALWSPDGSRISITAHAPAGTGVYVMTADGTHVQLVAQAFEVSAAPWSPDGSRLTYSATNDGATVDVFVVPSDGGAAPTNLTNNSKNRVSSAPDWARVR